MVPLKTEFNDEHIVPADLVGPGTASLTTGRGLCYVRPESRNGCRSLIDGKPICRIRGFSCGYSAIQDIGIGEMLYTSTATWAVIGHDGAERAIRILVPMRIGVDSGSATRICDIVVRALVMPDFMGEAVVAGGAAMVHNTECPWSPVR